jgi:hypothetical protein
MDSPRGTEIERLALAWADAKMRRAGLIEELTHLAARVPEMRRECGNPFFYSHPEEPDEGIANYTGDSSHAVGLPTLLAWRRVEREINGLEEQLSQLGVDPACLSINVQYLRSR